MEYLSDKSSYIKGRLSCIHFMAKMGILVVILAFGYFVLSHYYPLDFKKSPIASTKSVWVLYQYRYWLLGGSIALLLYVSLCVIRRFHDLSIPTKLGLIPLMVLYGGLVWAGFNVYSIINGLNIPMNDGIALIKLIRNFDKAVIVRIISLPYGIHSLKLPLYLIVYSYLLIFSLCVLLGGVRKRNRYGVVNRPLKIYHGIFALGFFTVYCFSVYFIVQKVILGNPFYYLDMLLVK